MTRLRVPVLVLLLVLGAMAGPSITAFATETADFCADAEEQAFLKLINDYRAANGLEPLVFSQTLGAAAEHHSQDMATNNFVGHTGSNGSTAEQRFVEHGYTTFNASAENVFAGDPAASGAFDWWKNSPGHNANMLSPTAKAIGIARFNNPDSMFGWYWTTTFGSDVDAAVTICAENGAPAAPANANDDAPAAPADNAGAGDAPAAPANTETRNPGVDGEGRTGEDAPAGNAGNDGAGGNAQTNDAANNDAGAGANTGDAPADAGQGANDNGANAGGDAPAADNNAGGEAPAGDDADGTNAGNDNAGGNTAAGENGANDDNAAGAGNAGGDAPAAGNDANGGGDARATNCGDPEELAFLALINKYRADNGLDPLTMGPALSAAADAHSKDMAENDFFDHTGSNGSSVQDRLTAAGYANPGTSAENIFAGDATAAAAFESWRNSPGHNANMLNPEMKAIGIGRAENAGSMFGWYWTTTFGSEVEATSCTGEDAPDGNAGNNGGANAGDNAGDNGAAGNNGNANDDRDGDGITNDDETGFFGTDPDAFDTDGGGVGDGDEFFANTDPLNPADDQAGNGQAGGADTDGDGIQDADETGFFGTDPNAFDTDGDGVGDGDEIFNGTDPLDPNSV